VAKENLPHILINSPETSLYTTTTRGNGGNSPPRNRTSHGEYLQQKLNQAWQMSEEEQAVSHSTRNGIYLEFVSDLGFDLELKSLENLPKQVRLLNVRKEFTTETVDDEENEQTIIYATIYVPHIQKSFFLERLEDYLNESKDTKKGNPKNSKLVDSISDIKKAILSSFWSDLDELIPNNDPEWIEVWLSHHEDTVIDNFKNLLPEIGIPFRDGVIQFPERAVLVIFANDEQLEELILRSDHIAEYRTAKTTADYWITSNNSEQTEWAENLLDRCDINDDTSSTVCILDTGINNGHPLLTNILPDNACQSVDVGWGTYDHDKHGTLMAGIAAYGDLKEVLESGEQIELIHQLESVKILPPPPEQNQPNIWGFITSQAISLAEIQAPDKQRTICMAVTAEDTRDRGRPSSWSAELDQQASGAIDNTQRLIIVSAGNTENITEAANNYPDTQITDSVHDPAQSWNVLSVGAFTELDNITNPEYAGYTPVAPKSGLSPYTTTSATWEENKWPIKPELVLEGGNLAVDDSGFPTECDDLSILSTFYQPQEAHFSTFSMTSAATAKLSWMAGKLQAMNPNFWPETIRGLLVHSADWPETLKRQFIKKNASKTEYKYLLNICGYGVPDLDRAMFSAQNSLTLIAQETIQPFDKKPKGGYKTKDMHLYELPWPKEALLELPDETPVRMRITLSYFIEPGPGEVGWRDRYRYASHALRFNLNSPGESKEIFVKRINKAARDKDEGKPGTKSPSNHWMFGETRNRGSIHSDIWQGTAADLADSNLIAISPTIGWWRERSHLGKWNRETRYTLIVSIETPDETVDVYTPVAVQVGVPVTVEVPV
jgi:subtilisin family serine protease